MRIRTIKEAYAWLRETDPDTAITMTALRRMVITGQLPSVRVGSKYLVNLDSLVSFLSPVTSQDQSETEA